MSGLTTALGIYIGELNLRHRSSILAGWMHGVFNSQCYGIWRLLFSDVNPLLGGIPPQAMPVPPWWVASWRRRSSFSSSFTQRPEPHVGGGNRPVGGA